MLSLRGPVQLNLPQYVNHLLNVTALGLGRANQQVEMIQEELDHNSWCVAMPLRGHIAQAETKPTQIQFLNDRCPLNSSTK